MFEGICGLRGSLAALRVVRSSVSAKPKRSGSGWERDKAGQTLTFDGTRKPIKPSKTRSNSLSSPQTRFSSAISSSSASDRREIGCDVEKRASFCRFRIFGWPEASASTSWTTDAAAVGVDDLSGVALSKTIYVMSMILDRRENLTLLPLQPPTSLMLPFSQLVEHHRCHRLASWRLLPRPAESVAVQGCFEEIAIRRLRRTQWRHGARRYGVIFGEFE